MPKFREELEDDVEGKDNKKEEEVVDEDEGVPEKFRGKSRKEIASSYAEAERVMHEKAAENAKLKAMLDMQDLQKQKDDKPAVGEDEKSPDKPTSGPGALKEVLASYARAAYTAAMQDSVTLLEIREGFKGYLDKYPHLRKAGRLFQSAVQEKVAAAKGDSTKTIYDILEEARTSTEEILKEAGGSVESKQSARGRLLEGGESVESRSATKRREAAKEESNDDSLEGYLAERQQRRRPSL